MPSIDCLDEIVIHAPASVVFDVVADYPGWSRWNPSYTCRYVGADSLREGARVHHQYGRKPFILSDFTRTIDVITPGQRLEESYVEGDLLGRGVWRFEEEGSHTTASYHCRVNSNTLVTHISFLLMGARAHSGVYQAILKKLKAHCESL